MYVTAVHWSLTQFTPSSMDVAPGLSDGDELESEVATNEYERIFSVIVTMAGLIVFSLFLGSINQALAKLRRLSRHGILLKASESK